MFPSGISQGDVVAEEGGRGEIQVRRVLSTVVSAADGRRESWSKNGGWLLEAENHPSLKARKKTRISDLRCMKPNSANNLSYYENIFFPNISRKEHSLLTHLNFGQNRKPAEPYCAWTSDPGNCKIINSCFKPLVL